ncbi:aspartyl protease family protein [Chitinophaga sp. GCM10012297]|uniref:Aspartyl protease family protein n=1 Tax=Chitinophaga chungangae TaxID=2821488 RepID=A0ABS3YGI6_9BACT|nr:aspartyl protease family protein [Chitinophaga chungangae]MBO9153800.1 aspartyl protease family protein [Chitinophaga chungangae]
MLKRLFILANLTICSLAVFSQVPIQVMESGHITIKAKVDGVEGNFILDTGAGLTVFTKKFFEKIPHKSPVDGGFTAHRATGERLDIDLYKVYDFQLGALHKSEDEVSFLDINLGGLDGILSLKLFEQQPFTIDFTKKELVLETERSLSNARMSGERIPLQLEQSRGKALDIFAYFRVNDSLTLQLCLDSGAGKDVYRFNSKYLQKLGLKAIDSTERKSEINTSFVSKTYRANVAKLAAERSPSIAVTAFRAQFVDGLIYDGIMWINWLGSRITVDIPGKELVVVK